MSKVKIEVDRDLEDLIPGFMENRINDISLLEAALKNGDFEKLKSIGHKIAGNAGGYGFEKLGDLASDLELKSMDKDVDELRKILGDMKDYLGAVEVIFVE